MFVTLSKMVEAIKDRVANIIAFISLIMILLSINYIVWIDLLFGIKLLTASGSLYGLSYIIKHFVNEN